MILLFMTGWLGVSSLRHQNEKAQGVSLHARMVRVLPLQLTSLSVLLVHRASMTASFTSIFSSQALSSLADGLNSIL
ncbi:hypothetical protein V6N12_055191 [Hibiscus sabdariffa]|uniref:Secreted protein n=1 Tax=Hibiscus sabdariffa TaxID=183260 RepID=A0ABR1ZNN9_9ROSI